MGLFSKKNKDKLNSKGKAKILDKKVMKDFENKDLSDVEHIIRTTDSMHLVNESMSSGDATSQLLGATKDAIARNYELARKRIVTTYQEIYNSGNYISVPFMTIQINLINYERKWSVKHIQRVIESFNKGVVEEVAKGKSVALSERLVIEAVQYVNKVIPATTVISNVKEVINGYTWEELTTLLIKKHRLSNLDIEVVEEYVNLLDTNIEQGYYIKIDKFLVTRIRVSEPTTILLFSNETLREVNHMYISQKKKQKAQTVSRTNMVDHFEKTESDIKERNKKSLIVQDVKELDDFTPHDDVSDADEKKISTKRSIELEQKLIAKQKKDAERKTIEKSIDRDAEDEETGEIPIEENESNKPLSKADKKAAKAAAKAAAKEAKSKKKTKGGDKKEEVEAKVEPKVEEEKPAAKPAAKKPAAKKPAAKPAAKKPAAKKPAAKKTTAKPAAKKPAAKKPAAKKPAAKKPAAKKPAAKPAAKKPAAKKPAAKKPAAKKPAAKKPAAKKK